MAITVAGAKKKKKKSKKKGLVARAANAIRGGKGKARKGGKGKSRGKASKSTD